MCTNAQGYGINICLEIDVNNNQNCTSVNICLLTIDGRPFITPIVSIPGHIPSTRQQGWNEWTKEQKGADVGKDCSIADTRLFLLDLSLGEKFVSGTANVIRTMSLSE
jgi:hypothetical protein